MGHFCVSLFPLFAVYATAPGTLQSWRAWCRGCPRSRRRRCRGPRVVRRACGGVKRGDETREWGRRCAPGSEAFIKLALSQHRAIIAEWITSSHPGSHAIPVSPSCSLSLSLPLLLYCLIFSLALSLPRSLSFRFIFFCLIFLPRSLSPCLPPMSFSIFSPACTCSLLSSRFSSVVVHGSPPAPRAIWRVSNLFRDLDATSVPLARY